MRKERPNRVLTRPDGEKPLLLGFLILSIFLHLVLLYLLPNDFRPASPFPSEPIMVDVVAPPLPSPPRQRELEFAPKDPAEDRTRQSPGKRLGERDIIAKKETAPPGKMPEDRRAPSAPTASRTQPPPRVREPLRREAPAAGDRPRSAPGPIAREQAPIREAPPVGGTAPSAPGPPTKVPDLNSLLQLPPTTVARLEGEWRKKYRPDVEKGNAVWLDTEKDLLISFFQRFKNNIYSVWNYPASARDRGEQGTCLVRVTIHRDGSVAEVKLLESSGFSSLDQEAMAAVRKGAPYGSLPRAYEEETLHVFAFFNYSLTRKVIY